MAEKLRKFYCGLISSKSSTSIGVMPRKVREVGLIVTMSSTSININYKISRLWKLLPYSVKMAEKLRKFYCGLISSKSSTSIGVMPRKVREVGLIVTMSSTSININYKISRLWKLLPYSDRILTPHSRSYYQTPGSTSTETREQTQQHR